MDTLDDIKNLRARGGFILDITMHAITATAILMLDPIDWGLRVTSIACVDRFLPLPRLCAIASGPGNFPLEIFQIFSFIYSLQ